MTLRQANEKAYDRSLDGSCWLVVEFEQDEEVA